MLSPQAESIIEMYNQYRLPGDAPARTVEDLREMTRQALAAQPDPEEVEVETVQLAGRPAERTHVGGLHPERFLVYAHGGGYLCGSSSLQRLFLAEIAKRTNSDVFAVDYRLAPEHPYPAAIDDVASAYIAAKAMAGGRSVAIGGDSAGGGLALGTVLRLRSQGVELPSAAFAISPWADLTLTSETLVSLGDRDIMVRLVDLQVMRANYLGSADPEIAEVSPALADLSGICPLLVQVGSEELLLGDAQRLVERARACGVEAQLEVADGMFHTWPVLAPALPESEIAIKSLTDFLVRSDRPE